MCLPDLERVEYTGPFEHCIGHSCFVTYGEFHN